MAGEGSAWQGECMVGGAWQGGMYGRGACMAGGHVWQGTCMAGGVHGSSLSRTQAIAVRGERVATAPPSLSKNQHFMISF